MNFPKLLLVAAIAGCASAAQKVYVAPTNDTVTSNTELGAGSTPSHNIYVTNASTEPIIVFGTSLTDCENVRQQCESRPMNLLIPGGQRKVVLRVEPRNARERFSYRFSYSWRPEKKNP